MHVSVYTFYMEHRRSLYTDLISILWFPAHIPLISHFFCVWCVLYGRKRLPVMSQSTHSTLSPTKINEMLNGTWYNGNVLDDHCSKLSSSSSLCWQRTCIVCKWTTWNGRLTENAFTLRIWCCQCKCGVRLRLLFQYWIIYWCIIIIIYGFTHSNTLAHKNININNQHKLHKGKGKGKGKYESVVWLLSGNAVWMVRCRWWLALESFKIKCRKWTGTTNKQFIWN